MITHTNVHGTTRPISPEHNASNVYIRFNVTTHERAEEGRTWTEYTFDEYVLTANEYDNIRMGTLPISVPEWTDALRSIERSELYRRADDMISKYSTDVMDDAKREEWVAYKRGVRESQRAEGYPQRVMYPPMPERGQPPYNRDGMTGA